MANERKPAFPPAKRGIDGIWQHDLFEVTENQIQAEKLRKLNNLQPAQLFVSNLHYNVSKQDLFDLFSEIGRLLEVSLHFDKAGRSLGTANVVFELKVDALEAIRQYNGSFLDQQPMKIVQVETSMNMLPIQRDNQERDVNVAATDCHYRK